jgi:predicted XRE-type DNA-binding protein
MLQKIKVCCSALRLQKPGVEVRGRLLRRQATSGWRAIHWQRLQGLTQLEIAERMGVSKDRVEKYMIRTLRHLRDRLDTAAP